MAFSWVHRAIKKLNSMNEKTPKGKKNLHLYRDNLAKVLVFNPITNTLPGSITTHL